MRITIRGLCILSLLGACGHADAAPSGSVLTGQVAVFPPRIEFVGPRAFQQLLVEARSGGDWLGDVTARARFTSSNSGVVRVDAGGLIRPVAEGRATVTAIVEG